MNFGEAISLSFNSLRMNKMRAFLTLLGVIIGIASVISILTLGTSLQKQTTQGLSALGAGDITASVSELSDAELDARADGEDVSDDDSDSLALYGYGSNSLDPDNYFDPALIDKLLEQFSGSVTSVSFVTTYMSGELIAEAVADSDSPYIYDQSLSTSTASIAGVNESFLAQSGQKIIYGRGITREDVDDARNVIVIPTKAANTLFKGSPEKALGNYVSMSSDGQETDFMIVGVCETVSTGPLIQSDSGSYVQAYSPYTVINELKEQEGTGISSLSIRPTVDNNLASLKGRLQDFFDKAYADTTAKVTVTDLSSMLDQVNMILAAISAVISAIAGISLLVGGIGVMNIMLVSVTERTREIGIRKALGAKRRDIRVQFITEAVIICLVGGILGIVLGGVIGIAGSALLDATSLPPLWGIIISLVFSMAIGLFFGYYPANKAAKLQPIDALRYE